MKKIYVLVCALLVGMGIGSSQAQTKTAGVNDWRVAALHEFDRDSDGRLSDAERETMRKKVFADRRRSTGRGGGGMMFPPEIVVRYDKDGDGSLNETEGRAAQEGLMKMFQDLQRKYDANRNGNFEPPEIEKLQADAAAGKLEEVPRFFIQMLGNQGRRPGSRNPSLTGQSLDLRQMDRDGDGRLDEEELRAARAALKISPTLNGRN